MKEQEIYLELLVFGTFALACYKARAKVIRDIAQRSDDLFRLTDRVERLRRSWWLWLAMLGILTLVQRLASIPPAVEWTAALQFIGFLALPASKQWIRSTSMTPAGGVPGRRYRYTALPVSEIRSEMRKFFTEISPRL